MIRIKWIKIILFYFLFLEVLVVMTLDGTESEADFSTEALISNFWISLISVLLSFRVKRKSL